MTKKEIIQKLNNSCEVNEICENHYSYHNSFYGTYYIFHVTDRQVVILKLTELNHRISIKHYGSQHFGLFYDYWKDKLFNR